MITQLPEQVIPLSEKMKQSSDIKGVSDWVHRNCEYYSSLVDTDTANKTEIAILLQEAQGVFNTNAYDYVTNPLAATDDKLKRYPAKLRNYDIVQPVIDRYMGERRERPFKMNVAVVNANVVTEKQKALQAKYEQVFAQMFVNELNSAGVQTGVESKPVPSKKEIEKDGQLTWTEERAKNGQEALNYIIANERLNEKFQHGFYYFLVTGRVFSYKTVENDEVTIRFINPQQVTVIGWDENSRYAEDAEAIIIEHQWSVSNILDRFRNNPAITKETVEDLISHQDTTITGERVRMVGEQFPQTVNTSIGDYVVSNTGKIPVEQILFTSYCKRGILYYVDDEGVTTFKQVDDSYKLNKAAGDIEIEWVIESEWWEVWRLTNTKFTRENNTQYLYLEYGVGKIQRNELSNTNAKKLPVNGTYFGYNPHIIDSIRKKGRVYNELYNILHFRFELTLARNKDKLLLFPIGLIPTKKGWTTEKWLHTINAWSVAFFDETSEKALAALQAMKEIDMSLSKYMMDSWNVMKEIKDEWWDAAGMNRQRYGQVNSSDGKGTNQAAVYQSEVSTRELVGQYEGYTETEGNGLIDYSKYAWIDGKKSSYILSDGRMAYFAINGKEHLETDYSVFVTSSIEENNKLKFVANNLLQPLTQNQGELAAIELLEANNFARIKEIIHKHKTVQAEFEQSKRDHEMQLAETNAQTMKDVQKSKNDLAMDIAELKAQTSIEEALIMSDSFNAKEGDSDADGIPESEEIVQRSHQRRLDIANLLETQRSNRVKENLEARKIQATKNKAK